MPTARPPKESKYDLVSRHEVSAAIQGVRELVDGDGAVFRRDLASLSRSYWEERTERRADVAALRDADVQLNAHCRELSRQINDLRGDVVHLRHTLGARIWRLEHPWRALWRDLAGYVGGEP